MLSKDAREKMKNEIEQLANNKKSDDVLRKIAEILMSIDERLESKPIVSVEKTKK